MITVMKSAECTESSGMSVLPSRCISVCMPFSTGGRRVRESPRRIPARFICTAVRKQGDRRSPRPDCDPGDAGKITGRAWNQSMENTGACLGEGIGLSLLKPSTGSSAAGTLKTPWSKSSRFLTTPGSSAVSSTRSSSPNPWTPIRCSGTSSRRASTIERRTQGELA